jgi:hypothetical protein
MSWSQLFQYTESSAIPILSANAEWFRLQGANVDGSAELASKVYKEAIGS